MCERLKCVRDRVLAACKKTGRSLSDITIVAVSKTKPASMVMELYECGQRVFGENYIQEGVEKVTFLSTLKDIEWHFIGHLQRNKAKLAARYFHWVETVDSERIASALDKYAAKEGKVLNVLIQVNIGQEDSKFGILPKELPRLLNYVSSLANLRIKGLMTIHPFSSQKEDARRWFSMMAALREEMAQRFPHLDLSELSMGMSNDYDLAIEEGATIVRIGTALFGQRK